MNIVSLVQTKKAFTLLEVLLALSLSLLLLSFLPILMKIVLMGLDTDTVSSRQITVFFNKLSQEIRESDVVFEKKAGIILRKSTNEVVTIEHIETSNQIRRTVNGVGFTPMLEDVNFFGCTSEDGLVVCHIKLGSGYIEERSMPILYGENNG